MTSPDRATSNTPPAPIDPVESAVHYLAKRLVNSTCAIGWAVFVAGVVVALGGGLAVTLLISGAALMAASTVDP